MTDALFNLEETPRPTARKGRPAAVTMDPHVEGRRSLSRAEVTGVGVRDGAAGPTPKPRKKRKPRPQVPATQPTVERGPDWWRLTYPAPATLYSSNGGKHWRVTAPAKKAFREASFTHATVAKLPKGLTRVRFDVELRFPTKGDRDSSNYHHNVAKPTVDGLGRSRLYQIQQGKRAGTWVKEVGYGLIPDDNPKKFLHCEDCPHIRIADEPTRDRVRLPYGQVVLTITNLSDEGAA